MAISRGSAWSKTFEFKSRKNGLPISLSNLRASFRDETGTTMALELTTAGGGLTITGAGQVLMTLNSAQTSDLTENTYKFAIYNIDDDNRRLCSGHILLEAAI
jgi:hypothetical protein